PVPLGNHARSGLIESSGNVSRAEIVQLRKHPAVEIEFVLCCKAGQCRLDLRRNVLDLYRRPCLERLRPPLQFVEPVFADLLLRDNAAESNSGECRHNLPRAIVYPEIPRHLVVRWRSDSRV